MKLEIPPTPLYKRGARGDLLDRTGLKNFDHWELVIIPEPVRNRFDDWCLGLGDSLVVWAKVERLAIHLAHNLV
jgi:hypothetical protein